VNTLVLAVPQFVPVQCFFFFFTSRRRHTRCYRDWSSDVCSSDLELPAAIGTIAGTRVVYLCANDPTLLRASVERAHSVGLPVVRSEERRVGKESGTRRTQER